MYELNVLVIKAKQFSQYFFLREIGEKQFIESIAYNFSTFLELKNVSKFWYQVRNFYM